MKWFDDPSDSHKSQEQELKDHHFIPKVKIGINNRSKKTGPKEIKWTAEMCRDALVAATNQNDSLVWSDICKKIATQGMNNQKQGINRAFKVTCAVFSSDSYRYHGSHKKSLGEYFEMDLSYWAGKVTFIYKRTFHNSEGLNKAGERMLKRLRENKPEAFVTLSYEGSSEPENKPKVEEMFQNKNAHN